MSVKPRQELNTLAAGAPGTIRDEAGQERDRQLGRRGERLVYELEQERGRLRGLPPDAVVWVSELEETADHDIRSIHDDGEPLFIEVKTTSGTHDRFTWPRAEFNRAFFVRDHYVVIRG